MGAEARPRRSAPGAVGGRPSYRRAVACYLAVDIGGTKLAVGLVDLTTGACCVRERPPDATVPTRGRASPRWCRSTLDGQAGDRRDRGRRRRVRRPDDGRR